MFLNCVTSSVYASVYLEFVNLGCGLVLGVNILLALFTMTTYTLIRSVCVQEYISFLFCEYMSFFQSSVISHICIFAFSQ